MFSIRNMGNTCYLNAALQCLFRLDNLNDALTKKNPDTPSRQFLNQYIDLKDICVQNDGAIVTPGLFIREFQALAAQKRQAHFCRREQNDTAEALQFILTTLHEAMAEPVKFEDVELDDPIAVKCREVMAKLYGKECSEVLIVFYGIQITSVKDTIIPEPFLSLDLPIPQGATHLTECLADYFKDEVVDDWLNETTNEKERVTKKGYVFRTPPVLFLSLKRFDGDKKNTTPVAIPEKLEFYDSYELQCVAAHHGGSLNSGHYVAHVRIKGNWVTIDDDAAHPCQDLSQNAYCMFYKKI